MTARKYPNPNPDGARMETGVVQFGDDWPGLFLRGDTAMGISISLLMKIRMTGEVDEFDKMGLARLEDLFKSVNEFGDQDEEARSFEGEESEDADLGQG